MSGRDARVDRLATPAPPAPASDGDDGASGLSIEPAAIEGIPAETIPL
jgi:hypothetical protein